MNGEKLTSGCLRTSQAATQLNLLPKIDLFHACPFIINY